MRVLTSVRPAGGIASLFSGVHTPQAPSTGEAATLKLGVATEKLLAPVKGKRGRPKKGEAPPVKVVRPPLPGVGRIWKLFTPSGEVCGWRVEDQVPPSFRGMEYGESADYPVGGGKIILTAVCLDYRQYTPPRMD